MVATKHVNAINTKWWSKVISGVPMTPGGEGLYTIITMWYNIILGSNLKADNKHVCQIYFFVAKTIVQRWNKIHACTSYTHQLSDRPSHQIHPTHPCPQWVRVHRPRPLSVRTRCRRDLCLSAAQMSSCCCWTMIHPLQRQLQSTITLYHLFI